MLGGEGCGDSEEEEGDAHGDVCDGAPAGKWEEGKVDGKGFRGAEEENAICHCICVPSKAGDRVLKDEGASMRECHEEPGGS